MHEVEVKGIICFGMGATLREGNREYFYAQLDRKFPGMKERYIRTFGNAYECSSPRNAELMALFHDTCEKRGIWHSNDQIFRYLSRMEDQDNANQLSLFD